MPKIFSKTLSVPADAIDIEEPLKNPRVERVAGKMRVDARSAAQDQWRAAATRSAKPGVREQPLAPRSAESGAAAGAPSRTTLRETEAGAHGQAARQSSRRILPQPLRDRALRNGGCRCAPPLAGDARGRRAPAPAAHHGVAAACRRLATVCAAASSERLRSAEQGPGRFRAPGMRPQSRRRPRLRCARSEAQTLQRGSEIATVAPA